jgi:hypothetical protein
MGLTDTNTAKTKPSNELSEYSRRMPTARNALCIIPKDRRWGGRLEETWNSFNLCNWCTDMDM